MCEVEEWARDLRETLSSLFPQPIGEKDFTDDRLAAILRHLSDDDVWAEIETRLGKRLIRVYDLGSETVRLDSTAAAVYHDLEAAYCLSVGTSRRDLGVRSNQPRAAAPPGLGALGGGAPVQLACTTFL